LIAGGSVHALPTPASALLARLPSAWLLDCEVFAEAIRPDPDLLVSEWADRHRYLTQETSAEPGPWRTDRVPYGREIMDVLSPSDPTPEVTFVAGTQVGKTELGNNFIGCYMDIAPCPMMMVYPTGGTGKRSSRTRITSMIRSTPKLSAKVSDKSRDQANTALLKQFPGGVLAIAAAKSPSDLKSMPVRILFEDEIDEYPEDLDGQGPAIALAEKRTDTFTRNKKIYRVSTPTRKHKIRIWGFLEKSDFRRYFVPCPHCGHEQYLRWPQMRYATRKVWEVVRQDDGEIVEVPAGTEGAKERDTGELVDVYYECESCLERIEERHKPDILARGRWIATRPQAKNHAGFHLPALYSPLGWFSWWDAVKQRLEADRDPSKILLKAWTNTVLAEPYEDGETVSELDVKTRAEKYRLGTVPAFVLLLTCSVDVQADRLEVKVKGYGREEESALVDYQVIDGDTETSAPWAALDEYLEKRFPHAIGGGATLKIFATMIDAGYRTQTVYDFTRKRGHRRIFACKGQSQQGKAILGRKTAQDVDHNGVKIPGGVWLYPIGTDQAKELIYARLKISQPGPGCMHFPTGLPDDYYKGLTAERRVTKYEKGFLKTSWEKEASDRNEPLDLEVYAYAAALFAGMKRVNWDNLEASLRATAQDLFAAAQASASDQPAADAAAAEAGESSPADAAADAAPATPAVQTSGTARQAPPARRRAGFINGWRS
jgi:phage terminase large subunit GpA-like protein